MTDTDSKNKALIIGNSALEKKADDVVVLNMQKVSGFCDYFVTTSAGSFKKTRAIADHIEESLAKEKLKPHHVEGKEEGHWILLDYGDVVAHVFYEETRRFYDIERLWGDAERIEL
ncbi:MAG: ribosome silencing factor [Candidatus Omnitrophica bacterium]|nr:ribosome silencing factor [Candidatus Omnitrophota bacterium]